MRGIPCAGCGFSEFASRHLEVNRDSRFYHPYQPAASSQRGGPARRAARFIPWKSEVQILPPLLPADIERVARRIRDVWMEWARRDPTHDPSKEKSWEKLTPADRKLWGLHAQVLILDWKDRTKTQEQRMESIRQRLPQEA
jgi:hypothetical protein